MGEQKQEPIHLNIDWENGIYEVTAEIEQAARKHLGDGELVLVGVDLPGLKMGAIQEASFKFEWHGNAPSETKPCQEQ